MKDPVHGTFRVTDYYDPHPNESGNRLRLTGVVTAPGIPATAGEHLSDGHGRWAIGDELPALIDRADPAKFVILWDEAKQPTANDRLKQQALQAAQAQADMMNAAQQHGFQHSGQPGFQQPGQPPIVITGGQSMTISQLPPETRARVQAAMQQAFEGMGGLSNLTGKEGARDILNAFGMGNRQDTPPPHGGFSAAESAQFLAGGAGERATAVVTAVTEVPVPPGVGAFAPPGGQADLSLEITKSDGSFYTATTRVAFSSSERRASIARPGNRLSVLIDPANPSRVAIDPTGRP